MRTELSILFREKKTKEFKESWRKKLEKIEVKELQDYSLSIFNFCNTVIKKAVEKGEKKGKGKNYTFSQNLFYLLLLKVLFLNAHFVIHTACLVAQMVKILPALRETWF